MLEETLQWRRIDRRIESTPSKLSLDDICFYYRDYIEGGHKASDSNQLVCNFKIEPHIENENPSRWAYKQLAVEQCIQDYKMFFNRFFAQNPAISVGLIPIPPSKGKSSIEYDNRMVRVAKCLEKGYLGITVCDVLDTNSLLLPAHLGGTREISEIKDCLSIELYSFDTYGVVFVLDDMITSGAHYVACKELLKEYHPNINVAGLFWSRKKV